MGHYTNEKRYKRVCDVLHFSTDYKTSTCTGASFLADFCGTAQYYDLSRNINQLPNLMANLGSTTDKFDEFKIDKITYKVQVMNARQLANSINYRAPDGTGQNTATGSPSALMINPQNYVHNTFVFHKRYQNDVQTNYSGFDFLDWAKCANAQKGACTFVNFFRQKAKMFNTAITAQRADTLYIDGTAINTKKDGVPIGWRKFDGTIGEQNIGQAGLIMPGIWSYDWTGASNAKPVVRVTMRVCTSLRTNAVSADAL